MGWVNGSVCDKESLLKCQLWRESGAPGGLFIVEFFQFSYKFIDFVIKRLV